MALDKEMKKEIISSFKRNDADTGSPEIQVAILSKKILILTEHLKENKQDHSSRLGMLKMVGKRKRLLSYLKKTNLTKYQEVVKSLKIRVK